MKSIYIYPYNDKFEELYDSFKESLVYYNRGEKDETIAMKMKDYMNMKQDIQNYLDKFLYDLLMVIPEQKVVRGEPEKEKRKCIYCGGNIKDGITRFKDTAHAIPEALGNVKFIQYEECDTCNGYFAREAEEDLCNLLVWKRLQYGLKGKNGYPVFQFTDDRYARFFNAKKEDYNSDWGHFEPIKSFVKEKNIKGPIAISLKSVSINESVDICYVKDYVPQHVYKTLVKCVIGLIGNKNLEDFSKTINWLRYKMEYIELPKVALIDCKRIVLEPELYIFTRKNPNDYNIPSCYGELRILDTIFVFIIPFAKKDRKSFVLESEIMVFGQILGLQYGRYKLYDFSSIEPQKIKENFSDYKQIELQ